VIDEMRLSDGHLRVTISHRGQKVSGGRAVSELKPRER